MPMDIDTYRALGLDQPAPEAVNGCSNADILQALNHPADRQYQPCDEALAAETLPQGRVRKFADWSHSRIYENTIRDLYLYQPAATHDGPYQTVIFNDGAAYLDRQGAVRAAAVLDYLHHHQQIEPTVAIFINPGRPPGAPPMGRTTDYDAAATQRSIEYDTLSSRYGEFLEDEVMPFAKGELGLSLSADPSKRTVCGISSGGICAFSCAWFAPETFGCVISHCGSFTNIRGGHNYPYLVRSTPRKPIRVFLQSGANDGTTIFGDWPTANQAMDRALAYAGYQHRFEFGDGGHTLRHGGAIFADTLKWLWRS